MNIGKSVVIKGELNGSEDLTIEGQVEGKIELKDHVLTIGPNGKIKAQVFAKALIVLGEVNGNVTATEKVEIRDGGSVDGDIISPRVAIAEGAHFRGSVDMQRKAGAARARATQQQRPARPGRRAAAAAQPPQVASRLATLTRVQERWLSPISSRGGAKTTTAPMTRRRRIDSPVQPTRALARFLAGLGSRQRPVLLDLGPVVGSNVTFFGEEVGCKILVEDLSKDIDRHVHQSKLEDLPAFFDKRFPQEAETIDGILCWDIFDYLERAPAERLARQLTRVLRPDGRAARVLQHGRSALRHPRRPIPATSSSTARTCSAGRTRRRAPSSGRC